MTIIQSMCSVCVQVSEMETDAIILAREGTGGTYRWFCEKCGELSEHEADSQIVALLLAAGVTP